MEFQQRLFELRRKAGLSQEELANLLGVTRQAVQKWESGTSRPDMDNLTALAAYFQVTIDYLVSGRETPPAAKIETVIHHYYTRWHYEYISKRTFLGLPLVHINCGPGICRAKGVIAIGNIATGFVALGGLAFGLLSLGGVSLGLLLALGGLSLGILSAGGLAAGLFTWGGIAFGVLTVGGVSFGVYSVGGVAIGSKVAVGGVATAPLAIGAAADGTQTFFTPFSGPALSAAQAAISDACQGVPKWIFHFLLRFAKSMH